MPGTQLEIRFVKLRWNCSSPGGVKHRPKGLPRLKVDDEARGSALSDLESPKLPSHERRAELRDPGDRGLYGLGWKDIGPRRRGGYERGRWWRSH